MMRCQAASHLKAHGEPGVLNELQEFIVDLDETEALLRLKLHRLPPEDFPRLRTLAPVLTDYDGMAELDEDTILLTGLAARLTPVP
jgi:hypothetical protein